MREDVPLAIPRLMPDQPQPSARIVAEPRWDVYYAVVFVASLAIVQAAPAQVSQRIIATAALAAMVPWYLFLGRPLMTQDQPATRKATVDLAGLVVLFAIAQSQAANAWVLAFGLLPMCFHVMTARRAMVFVVIINVIGAGLDAWRNPGLAGALTALGIAAFAIAFAYVYSRWMARVIEQSLDRAALIDQLEATRAELAAAHHEAGVQAERHRLAGDIHDTLAQGFTSIVTLLQAGQASLDAASPA
ncbi:MAG: histidine kinase dimerization/phosphoacceptor domain-containing protein, partial [Streptosporangiaceae bacterium]